MHASDRSFANPSARPAPLREPPPNIEPNPDPRRGFRLVLSVSQAPGPFRHLQGQVRYEAPDCAYVPDPIAGVEIVPAHYLPLRFEPTDDGRYAATVYADALLDSEGADGRRCEWRLGSVGARLKADGAAAETAFLIGLLGREILAQRSATRFYATANYPEAGMPGFPDAGVPERGRLASTADDDVFSIVLTSQESAP